MMNIDRPHRFTFGATIWNTYENLVLLSSNCVCNSSIDFMKIILD